MPTYDGERYSPAAAVATVSVRDLASGATVDEVSMLLDSGADISALPKTVVDALALPVGDRAYEVMAYDNSVRECLTVGAEVVFMRGRFKGTVHSARPRCRSAGAQHSQPPRYDA